MIDKQVIALFREAKNIVVLTGAGVSAASGIPTFRDAQTGLWEHFSPEELASPDAFIRNPAQVWQWYAWRRELVAQCEPNAAHIALAKMEAHFPNMHIVTQNVDGLHQVAGSKNVIELHGNIQRCKCFRCNRLARGWDRTAEQPPLCETCGSMIRPDVVWFGESLDEQILKKAWALSTSADVLLSVGTSSEVYPAAQLPRIALRHNVPVIEINPNPTPLTDRATAVIAQSAGVALPALLDAILR